ncbi:MAG: hypothetical protein AAGF57_16380 [Pseudomonadota bacterium]
MLRTTARVIHSYRLPITDYRLPITDYRLPITDYRLPIQRVGCRSAFKIGLMQDTLDIAAMC